MLPTFSMNSFSMESGLIFSNFAIEKLIEDDSNKSNKKKSFCNDNFFAMSKYIGKIILKCAISKNFLIWDPIDEVN